MPEDDGSVSVYYSGKYCNWDYEPVYQTYRVTSTDGLNWPYWFLADNKVWHFEDPVWRVFDRQVYRQELIIYEGWDEEAQFWVYTPDANPFGLWSVWTSTTYGRDQSDRCGGYDLVFKGFADIHMNYWRPRPALHDQSFFAYWRHGEAYLPELRTWVSRATLAIEDQPMVERIAHEPILVDIVEDTDPIDIREDTHNGGAMREIGEAPDSNWGRREKHM